MGVGTAALAGWAAWRRTQPARIDQRVEDALDELPDGLATRHPLDDRTSDTQAQSNATARLRRRITLPGGRTYDIDAGLLARLRITRL